MQIVDPDLDSDSSSEIRPVRGAFKASPSALPPKFVDGNVDVAETHFHVHPSPWNMYWPDDILACFRDERSALGEQLDFYWMESACTGNGSEYFCAQVPSRVRL